MAELLQNGTNCEYFEAIAQSAIDSGFIQNLVAARRRLVKAKRDIVGSDPAREKLFELIRNINQKMADLNDTQARMLLEEIHVGFENARQELEIKNLRLARRTIWEELSWLERQLRNAKPYTKEAIERVAKKPLTEMIADFEPKWSAANSKLEQLEEEERQGHLQAAAAQLAAEEQQVRDALAGNVDRKDLVRAKDLLGRLRANVQNQNLGAARTVMTQITDRRLQLSLISILGSQEAYNDFCKTKQSEVQGMSRNQHAKTRR
ncbi:MAG: hypothetical protein A3C02_04855 [Candidatus Andersenbacteria bacterium RIFCSPHIGHO2_02_FULL_45_11]|uniref:Uncharacterized protein n=1 Tax=Candidatus Andersenbacteria bacterium RIFCSPHIGHO2_12_FULL_45_11 TaxID=1797281 RepID=A0A1G1X102_9BACT|nr:MAG: hypothetical protein A2805_00945 [Candidatus Andersenbacteria bacterium RIFCSPHIGHO2_01_FULL_46_36]OGY31939.1 MAG: hypothetical protein A3C02_04855 [Candidatus Andersenbacteria bacterium RIFCSPHIGHO2_02_FULL_45_11]OGY33644.1 MAG: hypothetical protein A3D99_03805 [Candidatus Andersenbacteria bacterium RIFCSPHIGHO2_12_FULL_45_11]